MRASSIEGDRARSSLAVAGVLAGLAIALLLDSTMSWFLWASDRPALMASHAVLFHLAPYIPALLPCLLWPMAARESRWRRPAALAAAAGWWAVTMEIVPRQRGTLLQLDLPDWGDTALGIWRDDTWTAMGFIEFGGAVDREMLLQALESRAAGGALVLAALVPLLARHAARGRMGFAVAASLGMLALSVLPVSGWVGFGAQAGLMLACGIAFVRGWSLPRPWFSGVLSRAPVAVAATLGLAALVLVVKNCHIAVALAGLQGRLLPG